MTEELTLNAASGCISIQLGQKMIDDAIACGHQKSSLRWLVSKEQKRAMQFVLISFADMPQARYELEHGLPDNFMFAGVPIVESDLVPADEVRLEVITTVQEFGVIRFLATPSPY